MKKLLLAVVACCAFATPSFATDAGERCKEVSGKVVCPDRPLERNELPDYLQHDWCFEGPVFDRGEKVGSSFVKSEKHGQCVPMGMGRFVMRYDEIECRYVLVKTQTEPELLRTGNPVKVTKLDELCYGPEEKPRKTTVYLYAEEVGGKLWLYEYTKPWWRRKR